MKRLQEKRGSLPTSHAIRRGSITNCFSRRTPVCAGYRSWQKNRGEGESRDPSNYDVINGDIANPPNSVVLHFLPSWPFLVSLSLLLFSVAPAVTPRHTHTRTQCTAAHVETQLLTFFLSSLNCLPERLLYSQTDRSAAMPGLTSASSFSLSCPFPALPSLSYSLSLSFSFWLAVTRCSARSLTCVSLCK